MERSHYSRREFLRAMGAFVVGASVLQSGRRALGRRASGRRPNVVLIFTDDQGYQDVGVFGSPNIKTPHLDRMAAEGMKFTNFYVAASVCSPSRAALMTGCYPPRVGITGVLFPRHNIGLDPEEVTIADVLKERRYATACIGKWHLGHLPKFLPISNGFDYYLGIPYSNDMDPVKGKNKDLDRAWKEKDYSPWNVPLMRNEAVIERPADQTKLIERYTEEAVTFIHQQKDGPFFLYLPHTMPHIPLFVSDAFYAEDPQEAYQATIEQIDRSVGRILKALEDAGVDDDTLVIFTSDNGPWLSKKHHGGSALPLRDGKFSTYEGGMREPCIMRWPGKIPGGSVCHEVAATIDLLPTIARLAGGRVPTDRVIDGKDIWPLMTGEPGARSPHDAYYYYRGNKLEAIRSGQWKLIRKKQVELYNLDNDLGEKQNVADERPELVRRLAKMMDSFDKALKTDARPPGRIEE